jgi:2-phosphosulfolactate phosphatase
MFFQRRQPLRRRQREKPPNERGVNSIFFIHWTAVTNLGLAQSYPERMSFRQHEFDIRCEWGLRGLEELSPISDVVIVVDVLSFSTAVDVAVERRAVVFPYPLKGPSAAAYALAAHALNVNAELASPKRESGFSLSPTALQTIPSAYRLVLPSPNGGAICFAARCPNLMTACLRNASSAAQAAARFGSTFALVPAGETWPGGEIRPSLEDLIGAGSLISCLPGRRSPEAELAAAAFEHFRGNLRTALQECGSGKELIARGHAADVELAVRHDVSSSVPVLVDGAFIQHQPDA